MSIYVNPNSYLKNVDINTNKSPFDNYTKTHFDRTIKDDLEIDMNTAAAIFQRQIRSTNRFHLHTRIFNKLPNCTTIPTLRMIKELSQIDKIIDKLANDYAIIPSEISHITTWKNLSSICNSGTIYGARSLNDQKIDYDTNALSSNDINNGDGNVICLGAYLIDIKVLGEEMTIPGGHESTRQFSNTNFKEIHADKFMDSKYIPVPLQSENLDNAKALAIDRS